MAQRVVFPALKQLTQLFTRRVLWPSSHRTRGPEDPSLRQLWGESLPAKRVRAQFEFGNAAWKSPKRGLRLHDLVNVRCVKDGVGVEFVLKKHSQLRLSASLTSSSEPLTGIQSTVATRKYCTKWATNCTTHQASPWQICT